MDSTLLNYFDGDELAASTWQNKYALRDDNGNILEQSPTEMHRRLAKEFWRVEKEYIEKEKGIDKSLLSDYGQLREDLSEEKIFKLFDKFKYIVPAGSVMSGAGSGKPVSLSNCFVLPTMPEDSYSSIMHSRDEMVQLEKRRGGCIEENTNVIIKDRGIIPIKEVKVGDFILSFNPDTKCDEWRKVLDWYYTEVKLEDQIEIQTDHGEFIKTSKKHPLLVVKDSGYTYENYNSGNLFTGVLKTAEKFQEYSIPKDQDLIDLGWMIGMHFGDGTADKNYRIRILGDNENIIKVYASILNRETGSNCNYKKSTKKIYRSDVWEFTLKNSSTESFVKKYFDDTTGQKTYTWTIPSFIKNNNLMLPFLAGLIDSDGYITVSGRIDINTCSERGAREICEFLASIGEPHSVSRKESKRPNEHVQWCIRIPNYAKIYSDLKTLMKHEKKIARMNSTRRSHSGSYFLTSDETSNMKNWFFNQFTRTDKRRYENLQSNKNNAIRNKKSGICSLKLFKESGYLSEEKYNEITSRRYVKTIIEDNQIKRSYIDIEVEGNNNYYAGEFGFINIHNCGIDLSKLRPAGAFVNNAAVTSTGAASFMEGYSAINNEVAMNNRRGALMITLSIVHPDSPEFIEKKQDLTKVTGANVSVKIPDSFMKAVEKDEDFVLRWPIQTPITAEAIPELSQAEYNKLYRAKFASSPVYYKKVRARELWNRLIHCAWNTAEPGILFESQLHNWAPDGVYPEFRAVSTNPCGEVPMEASDSCRLIHCNLTSLVDNPYLENAAINYDRVYRVFYEATRLGDDLVSLEIEAVNRILGILKEDDSEKEVWEKILKTATKSRRAGVGFFGLSDLIASLGIKFCSPESIEITDHLCNVMMRAELDATIDLAIERGCFPGYDRNLEVPGANKWYSFVEETYPEQWERMQKYGRRNVSFSTIAPTGSVAMISRASSGIEPVFMPFYTRRRKCNSDDEHYDFIDKLGVKFQEFVVVHPGLENWAKTKYPDEDTRNWNLERWKEAFNESPWFGSTSPEIDWERRVELQGVVQKYITHAISSTVNLPNSVTEEEVSKIYMTAWKTGNKGQTVYRDGCRDGVLVSTDSKKSREDNFGTYVEAPKRPKSLEADFYTTRVKGELFYVMVGLYEGKPYEIFTYRPDDSEMTKIPKQHRGEIVKIKKGIYTFKSDQIELSNISKNLGPLEEAVSRFSSMLLRSRVNPKFIIDVAQKSKDTITGFVTALIRILSKYLNEEVKVSGEICPDCGSELVREGGCIICKNCGYSKCL